ncbi:uncharacterized protein [Ambystoma mexicanum]|uniref:uncharacterized protein isoform X2 n=1 Tax=Ambystoma mexicanum TaxID=8296 RepID=UPI0037E7E3A7
MEQDFPDPLSQTFFDGSPWMQVHHEKESVDTDALQHACALLMDENGKVNGLKDVPVKEDTGIPPQKANLESESADRINNNKEPFEGDIAQNQSTAEFRIGMGTEKGPLLEEHLSLSEENDEQMAAEQNESSEMKNLSGDDEWGGSGEENGDSFSDHNDSTEDLELQDVRNLLEEEAIEADDQGICVDQVSADVSDEEGEEVNEVDISRTMNTHHEGREKEIWTFGSDSVKHCPFAQEACVLGYKALSSMATSGELLECRFPSCQDSEIEMPSSEITGQELKLPLNTVSEDVVDLHNIQPLSLGGRRNKLLSKLEADDTIINVKEQNGKAEIGGIIFNNGSTGKTSCEQKGNTALPNNEIGAFAGASGSCGLLKHGTTNAFKELTVGPLMHTQDFSEDLLLKEDKSFSPCLGAGTVKCVAAQQEDYTVSHNPDSSDAPVQEVFDFDAEQLDVVEDKSEVSSQNSQDEVQHASLETEEDLEIEDDRRQQADMLQGERLFHADSIFHPPGARNYEYRLEDSYDGGEDKIEVREFMCDRGRDISDKLDPEILHLLELHLLKQQLVVIEEEEEEEEENDFDGFHINAHKLHFETFGPSRKVGHLLDMVLEEPELVEEKEQEEDDLKEVQLEDAETLRDGLDVERDSYTNVHNGMNCGSSEASTPEDIDIAATFADLGREESDTILQITLHEGVRTELSHPEELECCSEEEEQIQKDVADETQTCSPISRHPHCNHSNQEIFHIPPTIAEFAVNNNLIEQTSLGTLADTNQFTKQDEIKSKTCELKGRCSESFVEGTDFSRLIKTELPFHYNQTTVDSGTEISCNVNNTFCEEVDIGYGKSSVKKSRQDRRKTTDRKKNVGFFDDVREPCGQKNLLLADEFREYVSNSTGLLCNMSGEKPQIVSSTLTPNYLKQVTDAGPTALHPMCAESPSSQERSPSFSQQKTKRPMTGAKICKTFENENGHGVSENETEDDGNQDVKIHKEYLARKQSEDPLRGGHIEHNAVIDQCIIRKRTTSVETDKYSEKGPDVYTQLAEALEWAQASECRNSELHAEIKVLQSRCEILDQEKAELIALLSAREAEMKSFHRQREEHIQKIDKVADISITSQIQNDTEHRTLKVMKESSANGGGDRSKGNQEQYEQRVMRAEFGLLRQESRAMVEQLNSLQEDLRALHHLKKPSSFLRHLLKTGLVAALGILLFWWGTNQLG